MAQERTGTFQCCAAESVDRVALAHAGVVAWELDGELLGRGAYPQSEPPMTVPYDTSLDATTSTRTLGVELRPSELGSDPFIKNSLRGLTPSDSGVL